MFDPISFAKTYIDIPSPTEQELAAGRFLLEQLTELGYQCRTQQIAAERFNVYASAGGRPRVVLNSHIDTVPPWFGAREDDEYLYGRGACDTKGVIAAMLAAGEALKADGVTDFAYLFVVAEETDSIGAKMANVEFASLGSEYVLVGEPTESQFARASKGALTVTLRFDGIAGHSAYPERGDSAINKMVRAIGAITSADWGTHEILGGATVNVGIVRGGEKPNIIAPSAECEVMWRTVSDPESVRVVLERMVGEYGGRIAASRGNDPQFMVVPDGMPSTVVAFNTDVPHLGNLGKPLLFGPGSILDAHGANEKIAKKDLLAAVNVYRDTVRALLEQ
jgi:acetylornithine deacetylase